MDTTTSTDLAVAEALVLALSEATGTAEWRARHSRILPLIARVRKASEKRFKKQLQFFLADCLPLMRSTFEEAKRKPPKADTALDKLDEFSDADWERVINSAIKKALELGARLGAKDAAIRLEWQHRSKSVLEYLKTRSAKLIGKDIDATTKERITETLSRMYEEQATFADTVKAIRELWEGFTSARAELIAVTEMGNAFTNGTLTVGRDVRDSGREMEKSWLAEADACPICEGNAGDGWIPFDEEFSSGDDAPLQHPACRCTILTRAARKG